MLEALTRSLENTYLWLYINLTQIIVSIFVIAIFYVFRKVLVPRVEQYVERDNFRTQTFQSAIFTITLLGGLVTLAIILAVWGFNIHELLAVSTGILAVTGVALFATWSILSNVTAFFILLANPVFKRGNYIRIFDTDNYAEGNISKINIFSMVLITDNRETIIYPNNQLIARAIIVNPRERIRAFGKIDDFRSPTSQTDDAVPHQE